MSKKTSPEKKAKIQARKEQNKEAARLQQERTQWLIDNKDKLCQYRHCQELSTGTNAEGLRVCDGHTDEAIQKARLKYAEAMATFNGIMSMMDPTGDTWDMMNSLARSDRQRAGKESLKNRAEKSMR
jgi:hypothetical protein